MQKDKIRDMLRSILPSKAERSARFEKTHANKRNRVRVKQTLRQYNKDEWGDDSESVMEAKIHNSDRKRCYDIRMMKSERRAADKISHFVRWCEKKTAHIPEDEPKEKYFYISGLIGGPADIIREHALGHFMDPDYDFNVVARDSWKWSIRRGSTELNGSGRGLYDRAAVTKALTEAYETWPMHLNRALKGGYRSLGGCLYWRSCKEEDACTNTRVSLDWQYTYQATWGGMRVEWNKPYRGSFREGTLVSQKVERVITDHDEKICRNRMLVTCKDDIERLANQMVGWNNIYEKPRYSYYNNNNNGARSRVLPFLLAKGLLEDRDVREDG